MYFFLNNPKQAIHLCHQRETEIIIHHHYQYHSFLPMHFRFALAIQSILMSAEQLTWENIPVNNDGEL